MSETTPRVRSVTAELLAKYDRPGPRYTSYPTAVEFHEGFTPERYLEKLAESAAQPEQPLSLYIHLPFCRQRCSFCACNVIITEKDHVVRGYLADLEREIALVASRLGPRRQVLQYHWGGGTPTHLDMEEIQWEWDMVASRFTLAPGAEVAIEVDPRVTTPEQAEMLVRLGFNRFSMGVQDFDPSVQAAIHRNQTFEQTRELTAHLRRLGVESVNFDFIYGLPRQTQESFQRAIEMALTLRPDRVACYSWAFVPWIKAHQKYINPAELPPREVKIDLFGIAHDLFTGAGYEQIGMDHFALAEDSLARAARRHTLFRSFMGYTTHPARDTIGFGVSAIGDLLGAFAQNAKKLSGYRHALDRGLPPIERGFQRSVDDELRRDVIQSLMCNFYLDVAAIERTYQIDFEQYFQAPLRELDAGPAANGFLTRDRHHIHVTPAGRLFVRNVCMAFDAYLAKAKPSANKPVFSRTV